MEIRLSYFLIFKPGQLGLDTPSLTNEKESLIKEIIHTLFFLFFHQESLQAAVNDWNSLQAAVNDPRGVCVSAELVYLHLKEIWGVDVNTLMGFTAQAKVS